MGCGLWLESWVLRPVLGFLRVTKDGAGFF